MSSCFTGDKKEFILKRFHQTLAGRCFQPFHMLKSAHKQLAKHDTTRSLPKETKKAKRQKTKHRTLNEALATRQVESENSDEKEDAECTAIECIISTLENL